MESHGGSVSKQSQYPLELLFIKTVVNGNTIPAMVDTGATTSLIKLSTLKQVNYHHHIRGTVSDITLGDGKTTLWQYGSVDLCVKVNDMKTKVKVTVVDELAADFILGLDWIKFYDVHILPGRKQLKIHHRRQQTTVGFVEDAQIDVKLAQQYDILPGVNCIIQVKSSIINASHLYFQALHHHVQQQKGITVEDGLQQRKDIQQEIDKMLKNGIIIPSHSPWSSPVILLKKPNGEFRFIVDYRRLNAITRKDSYPQPTTEELLQRLGGHKWFTKLDLTSGYFQIPIQDCDKEKTAFCTQDGLYQFEVLSMGLMNAPPNISSCHEQHHWLQTMGFCGSVSR
ncbi:unnamed protein product [Didymodactylos carnosus]|uniref:Reverse transcriptase domain-containing protein n=1 Tax=Didymodactylos carnosus TaxID=1234261 RepID=A0A8S2RLM6_9BILA|nr:unnamed protein product [Didymodactylos carnosus]